MSWLDARGWQDGALPPKQRTGGRAEMPHEQTTRNGWWGVKESPIQPTAFDNKARKWERLPAPPRPATDSSPAKAASGRPAPGPVLVLSPASSPKRCPFKRAGDMIKCASKLHTQPQFTLLIKDTFAVLRSGRRGLACRGLELRLLCCCGDSRLLLRPTALQTESHRALDSCSASRHSVTPRRPKTRVFSQPPFSHTLTLRSASGAPQSSSSSLHGLPALPNVTTAPNYTRLQ
jgi:hypothetical protein